MLVKTKFEMMESALNVAIFDSCRLKKPLYIVPMEAGGFQLQEAPARFVKMHEGVQIIHWKVFCDERGRWSLFHVAPSKGGSIWHRRKMAAGIDSVLAQLAKKKIINNETLWGAK